MFDEITISLVFAYMLVLCRIGAAISMLPTMSEGYMFSRARLYIALGLSVIIAPAVNPLLPQMPISITSLVLLAAGEILIGFTIGAIAKITLSSLHVAGSVISYQSGLAAATIFDPNQGGQSSLISGFLTMVAIMLIFATNLHHIFLYGLVDSYHLFTPGEAPPLGDFANLVTKTVAGSFLVGMKFAAPQIIIGLILYLGAGIMSRLMPQMQVFFVLMPVQIFLGFFVLMITLSVGMMWFIDNYSDTMAIFIKYE